MSIDIKEQIKLYNYKEFKILGKLKLLNEDNMIFKYLEEDDYIALIEESIVIDNNLDVDELFIKIFNELGKSPKLIWFAEDVRVKNTLYMAELENYSNALVFEKLFETDSIIMGGIEITFLGDVIIHQILYAQNQAEGFLYISNAKSSSINIECFNQFYIKDGQGYNFGGMSEELIKENIDKIFLNREELFEISEDGISYYDIEEDKKLVGMLLNGEKVFVVD
jgi:hypothetical protein